MLYYGHFENVMAKFPSDNTTRGILVPQEYQHLCQIMSESLTVKKCSQWPVQRQLTCPERLGGFIIFMIAPIVLESG